MHIDMSAIIPNKAVNMEADLIEKSYMTMEDELDPK